MYTQSHLIFEHETNEAEALKITFYFSKLNFTFLSLPIYEAHHKSYCINEEVVAYILSTSLANHHLKLPFEVVCRIFGNCTDVI